MGASAEEAKDRALGALQGLAIGDALGMPTQTLSPEEIARRYGRVKGFLAPFEGHPVAHRLPAGTITDDTEQALLLARRLVRGGGFNARAWAQDLLDWEAGVRARGLRDLLGPSTKRALAALMAGAGPEETGRQGDTNGAAMRIAPVGIAMPPEPLGGLIDLVEATARITHNTGPAIGAAAAVAAAVSAGVAGAGWPEAARLALAAAHEGGKRGATGGADIAARIAQAMALGRKGAGAAPEIARVIGTGVAAAQSVPAAFGLVEAAGGDAWAAALLAANLGGDTDTIGAIAGAMAGACLGAAALPADAVALVTQVNRLELGPLAEALLARRAAPAEAAT
ncbi:MAG TPA: ADP-ribosylglycohydrolase family protein [Paracoccaceae bacterium]|nr:ADP-ribosylglycohydrolase family protein [Paracoccaceae bacterium]